MKKMKTLKRLTSLLLALMLMSAAAAAVADDEFVVGHTTQMKGDFFTEMFGNNTADIDVRALIHGYNLVHWDENQGVYILDPTVVKASDVQPDAEGNKVFTLTLQDDLFYSDGTPITAWDYAFSMLLMMNKDIEQLGGKIYRSEHILGSADYIAGTTPYLSGVGVKDEHTLVITLDKAFLPFFYELGLLMCEPYPISQIAPGCRVYSDGEDRNWNAQAAADASKTYYGMGVYVGNEDLNDSTARYTVDTLKETILNAETGYNSHPQVTSGPYRLVSFDGKTAHFEINPYFKGVLRVLRSTIQGPYGFDVLEGRSMLDTTRFALVKPTIEKIAFTQADNATMMQDLQSGTLDLINKVTYGPAIDEGLKNAAEAGSGKNAAFKYTKYPRVGLAYLTFTFEKPTVHEMEVRQAIAWCMDRDAMTKAYCGKYGTRVDGYYGLAQWEYLLATHRIDGAYNFQYESTPSGVTPHNTQENADWKALNLNSLTVYKVNTAKANSLLDAAGWTLNKSGEAYKAGTDDVRCKMVDGELVALDLSVMVPEGNRIVDTFQENFIKNLNACGIQLTVVTAPMSDLLASYYRETERTTDMIYLATNFHVVYDPSITFSTDDTAGHAVWNNTYSDDEELYNLAVDMRRTEPQNVYTYVKKWIRFQERYNKVLPAIPIYSNIYYDFYTADLKDYSITAHTTWSQAIVPSTLK